MNKTRKNISLLLMLVLTGCVTFREYKFEYLKEYEVHAYEYLGELTERQSTEIFLSGKNGKSETVQEILDSCSNNNRLLTIIRGDKSKMSSYDYAQPTEEELKEYFDFIQRFESHNKNRKLLERVYEEFQNQIGGIKSYDHGRPGVGFVGSRPIHPAVLFSKREKGVCFDKALALYDIYSRLGFDCDLMMGNRKDPFDTGHAWLKIKTRNREFEVDPTIFEDFIILKK